MSDGACGKSLADAVTRLRCAQEDDRYLEVVDDHSRRLDPIEEGHVDVHRDRVGKEPGRLTQSFLSVFSSTDHFDSTGAPQQRFDRVEKAWIVVHDKHADRRGPHHRDLPL